MTSSDVVVVSAHLDDAVLSASARIMDGGALVVTAFAGLPAEDQPPGEWDVITKAASARTRVLERIDEDDAALSHLGARAERLGEPDAQHVGPHSGQSGHSDQSRLSENLRPLLKGAGEVWLPAGIGGHPDHLCTRDAGLACLAGSSDSPSVVLYADVPYSIVYGWPTWVDPENQRAFLDVGQWLAAETQRAGLDRWPLRPTVRELDPSESERKARAVSEYKTQLAALSLDPLLASGDRGLLGYEVCWQFQR